MKELDVSRNSKKSEEVRKELEAKIVGQPEAKQAFLDIFEINRSGLSDPNRPIGSMLFLGPTGTGKTRVVEALAEILFGNERAVTKIDCTEFQHSGDIAKLVGSPPGYIGHMNTPARLLQGTLDSFQTPEHKFNLVLFDEIEKANDALWHLMLGILDKAIITLGDNSVTHFDKSIIVMTSNAGSTEINKAISNELGFHAGKVIEKSNLDNIALTAARKKFTPEFINRLDKIVPFDILTQEQILKVVDIELNRLQTKIYRNHQAPFFNINVSPEAMKYIADYGYDARYNGRSVRRAIEVLIQLPLAHAITTKQIEPNDDVYVEFDKELKFKSEPRLVKGKEEEKIIIPSYDEWLERRKRAERTWLEPDE